MFRKITIAAAVLLSISAFGQGRTHSVGSGPMVAGTTVSGIVTGVNGNVIALANGLITIDASSAKITDDHGGSGSIASITPGATIFAVLTTSTPAANAPLPASIIGVHRIAQVQLSGPVQSVGTNTLTVLGRTIAVDSNTSFGGHARSLADILTNDIVSIEANASGTILLATSVLDFPPFPVQPNMIQGTVKTIGTDSWVITEGSGNDRTILINAQTKIIGDPKIGDSVQILVTTNSANQYVAVSIMKVPPPPATFQFFTGTVKSIGSTSWVIHDTAKNVDVTVAVDSSTRISNAIAVGDTVTVTIETTSSGSRAITIIKFGGIPMMSVSGVVKSIVRIAVTCPAPPNPCAVANWDIGPGAGMYGPDFNVLQTTATVINGNPQIGDRVTAKVQMNASTLTATEISKQ